MLPSEDVTSSVASLAQFDSTVIGEDLLSEERISNSMHNFLAELFPYLYTNGQGYYSMKEKKTEGKKAETNGGMAILTIAGLLTLEKYVKKRLLMADKRFARDPA